MSTLPIFRKIPICHLIFLIQVFHFHISQILYFLNTFELNWRNCGFTIRRLSDSRNSFYWAIGERNTSRVPDRAAHSRTTSPLLSLPQKSPNDDLTNEWGHIWKGWKIQRQTGIGRNKYPLIGTPLNPKMPNGFQNLKELARMASQACEVTSGGLVPRKPYPRGLQTGKTIRMGSDWVHLSQRCLHL